jgi:predicted RNA-binding Zn-ribbon protein involved in translation (DUF1610 family)
MKPALRAPLVFDCPTCGAEVVGRQYSADHGVVSIVGTCSSCSSEVVQTGALMMPSEPPPIDPPEAE